MAVHPHPLVPRGQARNAVMTPAESPSARIIGSTEQIFFMLPPPEIHVEILARVKVNVN